jgi:hypothetical protein
LIAVTPANATNSCNKKLQLFSSDTGVIAWQSKRLDSPRDPNSTRLAVHVLRQDGDDYDLAWSKCSGLEHKLVGQVKNLSFEFLNETGEASIHNGAGSPRLSVDIDKEGDGDYDFSIFLAGSYCNEPMAEDTRWSRADFTGRTLAGCELQADGVSYISDGTESAWQKLVDAHPEYKLYGPVGPAYLVMDEEGTAFVDRLAFGNIMYVSSGTGTAAVKTCSTESSC